MTGIIKRIIAAAFVIGAFFISTTSMAQGMNKENSLVTVGGAPMYPAKNIVEHTMDLKDHTTLVAAVKAACLLTYLVIAAKLDSKALAEKILEGNRIAELETVAGRKLWTMMKGNNIVLKDEAGGMSTIVIKNVYQRNGVIHVVDHVVLPKS